MRSAPGTPEESEKSPERVPRGRAPKMPKECAPDSRSLKRVRKESESQVCDSFETLFRLRGALFGHFWGPAPGYSFWTLFGLFRGSRPEGPGRPCVGRGRSQAGRIRGWAQGSLCLKSPSQLLSDSLRIFGLPGRRLISEMPPVLLGIP